MTKKTRPSIIIIMIFLLSVIMPFIDVQGASDHTVVLENPADEETFAYSTTNEVFEGYSITTECPIDTSMAYTYTWWVDTVFAGSGGGNKMSSHGGVVILEKSLLIDISTYDVGAHDVKLYTEITGINNGFKTHTWYRDEAPPTPAPSVTFTNPSVPSSSYNFSTDAEGITYNCRWTISDENDDIATMNLYLDDVLQREWTDEPEGNYEEDILIDTEKLYTIKVNGTDDDSNDYSTTTYLLAYEFGQHISVIDPDGQYHNSEIDFTITSGAPDGLDNMSYSIEDYGYWDSDVTSDNADVSMDTTWSYEYGLLSWSQYISGVEIIYGDRYAITANWYNLDWTHRIPMTITYTSAETYMAVDHTIDMGDPVYARDLVDGDDWVVTESDGETVVPHWIEDYDDSGDTLLWFNASTLSNGDTDYYLYYGNAGASNSEDPESVFYVWDNFDDGYSDNDALDVLDRGWSIPSGTPTIQDIGGDSMVLELFLDDSEGTNDQALNIFTPITDCAVHYNFWINDGDTGQSYFQGMEGATSVLLSQIHDDNSWLNHDGSSYVELTPVVDVSLSTWFETIHVTTTTTYDMYIDGVEHAGDTRNNPTVGIDRYYIQTADTGDGDLTVYVDDFFVYAFLDGMSAVSGSEEARLVLNNDITVTESGYETGLTTQWNSSWGIEFTATATCVVEWINITLTINETVFYVYTSSAATSQSNEFTINDTAWASLSEGWFNMNVSCYDDNAAYFTTNLSYYIDTTSPVVTLRSPENRTTDDPYSNLQIIPLDYKIEDDVVPDGSWTNDMKWLIIDGETFTGDEWSDYPKYKPLIFWEGLHNLTIRARDWAGNEHEESVGFYYEARLEKPLTLTFTSSVDDEIINPEQYLNIYLDGMPISAVTTTNLNGFDIDVYDKFGILLNSTFWDYYATIDIDVPLRPVTFVNNNTVMCNYIISYDLHEQSFWIVADGEQTYYLNDTDYVLVAVPGSTYINDTHWYATNTFIQFTVESEMGNICVTLNVQDDDPMNDPLEITTYRIDIDTDLGFIYTTYTTSWGNTTIRVFDNDTGLAIAQDEGMFIWTFDETDYGMHNITIFIYNGEDTVFTDGFSFYLEEPEEDPNYYVSISVSVDADGGLFYVSITTSWGNQTIRVSDNGVWLGTAQDEGNSIWSFDESIYGLHNFSIFIYNGGDTWDVLYTSVTIVEPSTESNYYLTIHTSVDVDGGLFYVTINTYFENCTINVWDNGVSLGDNVTEGTSIWSFDEEVYGLHNFSIYVYQGDSLWDTIYSSITIVEPSAETNYYLIIETSIDAESGLFYVTIETYFGNCTVQVFDNDSSLGSAVDEGSSVWQFDEDVYGLHNFNISVFQGGVLWDSITTSITIVEPDAETNYYLVIETSVDAESGLFYVTIETYFGNCTVRIMDNETWLGDNVSEGSSIWAFTETDYGLHNFSISIYHGYDLWDTIVTSVTIVEPATETNYYLTIDTSIDADGGLFYVSINTYWGNQTIEVFDNDGSLGSAVSEGASIWSFDESVYGLHNFSIFIYNGEDTWDVIYTSVTIVEPSVEINYYLTIETSVDADGGLFYVTINTYFGNCTVRVMDNETWLGDNATEGSSIWSFDEEVYGLHNFSIFIYQGYDLWDTIVTGVTMVEPSAETNYYLTIDTSIDASGGLFYVTIETYFGNCTIRISDNDVWLGDNVSEGSSIWEFDESIYGLHNFSVFVYQGDDLWNMIYTSVTIVEPDLEVLALTIYDKVIDADAGLIYINYQTNWGNTTIRIMDNTTWIGSEVSNEENSIWTFTTDYGLHNITVVIYNDGVPWFTDVFSFTIIVPYQIWKELTFIFTSDYDSAIISALDYLDIYLNDGMKYIGVVQYDTFNISVYDRFGQLLYAEVDRLYAETISISLPMRLANFINPNSVICYYRLALGIYEQSFWITQTQTIGYYMLDGNYTIIAEPTILDAGGGYEYVSTTDSFEVTGGMSDIGVTLATQQITIIYRPITIRTTSSYTGVSVGERYLKYYLNGTLSLEGATTSTCLLIIRLAVTDVFGNVLYNQSVAYARYMDITVPLRSCTFTNKELVSTTLTITQSGSDEHLFFVLGGSATIPVFLSDNTYKVIHAPISPDKEEGVLWQPKDYDFTCSLASQSLDMWLDTFDNVPPLFDEFGGNILDWLTNNRWLTIAALGFAAVNLIGLVFAVGVIITRLPKREEKGFESK